MTELVFKPDKKHRDKYLTAGHFAHPAKMILPLQRWLVERYTQPGDVILDPMAGSGTILIACTMGRNVVAVELEDKFIKMQRDNWAKIQTIGPEMGSTMGTATIHQGDARALEGLLADTIITSPPYADRGQGQGKEYHPERMVGTETGLGRGYSDNPSNIGNLPYGNVDSIITSPPYEGQIHPTHETTENVIATNDPAHLGPNSQAMLIDGYGSHQSNIGNLKNSNYLEAMLAVYRQCYAVLKSTRQICGCCDTMGLEAKKDGQTLSSGVLRRRGLCSVDRQGSEVNCRTEIRRGAKPNQGLLGESGLPEHIPLQAEIQIHPTQRQKRRGIQNSSSELTRHQDNFERLDAIPDSEKGRCNQDITGDRKEAPTHGEVERRRCNDAEAFGVVVNQNREVLPLLQQKNTGNSAQERDANTCPKCHQKIRYEGGLLILVTKNFIRNKKLVRLDEDTIKLCEKAGFTFKERHYRKLTNQSFWRTIYKQKYPEAPEITHEDILVFVK